MCVGADPAAAIVLNIGEYHDNLPVMIRRLLEAYPVFSLGCMDDVYGTLSLFIYRLENITILKVCGSV